MARLLTGKEVTAEINEDLMRRTEILKARGVCPTLGVVRLGQRPDDLAYEKNIEKRAEKVGVTVQKHLFPEDMEETALLSELEKLNAASEVHGILIFRPLPKQIDDLAVRCALSPEKDVDGITELSQASVYTGSGRGFAPCTAQAVMELLAFYGIDPAGKRTVVIGRSQVIGKPVAMLLLQKNATVTICHTKTRNLAEVCRGAELIVTAAGRCHTLTGDCLSEGQTIIDVAINFDENGKLSGDADFDEAEKVADAITPVPGGIGGITPSVLLRNVIFLAEAASRS